MAISATEVRIRRVQRLVASRGLDGLILIGGIDGADNIGSRQALAYLFQVSSASSTPTPRVLAPTRRFQLVPPRISSPSLSSSCSLSLSTSALGTS